MRVTYKLEELNQILEETVNLYYTMKKYGFEVDFIQEEINELLEARFELLEDYYNE